MAKTIKYKAHSQQSHFDMAIQLFGDFSKIGEILKQNADINNGIAYGFEFTIEEQIDPQAVYFKTRTVATDVIVLADVIYRRVDTASTDLRITDTGDIRIVLMG